MCPTIDMVGDVSYNWDIVKKRTGIVMTHIFFDIGKLREDVKAFADVHSYREFELRTAKSISKSKVSRFVVKKRDLHMIDIELLMAVLNTNYDDYIVRHML